MLDFRYRRARKAPPLSEAHKRERLAWCIENRYNSFENFIFFDESKLKFDDCPLFVSRLPGRYPNPAGTRNDHLLSVNIWGGISAKGATQFIVKLEIFYYLKKS